MSRTFVLLLTAVFVWPSSAFCQETKAAPKPARGPLRVHPENPRYFADADGQAVLLVGSHTWNNLIDMGPGTPPPAFDYSAYLDFLERHGHNFIRLWAWDSVTWDSRANGRLRKDEVHNVAPLPWARTGPGNAVDGEPRFDLTKFNPDYFTRLRDRVDAAGKRGIYVSVMLFEGWGLRHGNRGRAAPDGWAWRGHPFHPDNNINGIDGNADGDSLTGEVHTLTNPQVNELQAAYIRKVVDTVSDFDNVLYEVINEGGQKEWDWWVAKTVRDHEQSKPKQHPIGITGHGAEKLADMLASPAEWISPGRNDGYGDNPPAWDGKKVSLLDTDHIWGVGGNSGWVWKSFLRGHNPIFMDPYDDKVLAAGNPSQWDPLRRAMGHVRRLSQRFNLAEMSPHDKVSSSKFCLAQPGEEYLVWISNGGETAVDLTSAPGTFAIEWIHPTDGSVTERGTVDGGALRGFLPPLQTDMVLHLRKK